MGRSTLKKANQESTPIDAPTKYGDQRFILKYRISYSSMDFHAEPGNPSGEKLNRIFQIEPIPFHKLSISNVGFDKSAPYQQDERH